MPGIFYMGAEDLNSGSYGCTYGCTCALTHGVISAAWETIILLIVSDVKIKRVKQAASPTHVLL